MLTRPQAPLHAPSTQPNRLLQLVETAPFRYAIAIIFGAFITLLIFLIMTALIRTHYIERSEARLDVIKPSIEKATQLEIEPTVLEKMMDETQKLKNPIVPPPAIATKLSIDSQEPPRRLDVETQFNHHFTPPQRPEIDITIPDLSVKPGARKAYATGPNGASGQGKDRGDRDGTRKCTIIFTVGATPDQIADLKWIECMTGSIANSAETALYQWVTSGAADYHNLKPEMGDEIEFTYKL